MRISRMISTIKVETKIHTHTHTHIYTYTYLHLCTCIWARVTLPGSTFQTQNRYVWFAYECCVCCPSVVSNSFQPHGLCPPGSSGHGIFQARILEWVAISSSRRSSWPRHQTWLHCPWESPGNNIGVGCHALHQGIFPTQGWNSPLLHFLHW